MGKVINTYQIIVENLKGREYLGDKGVNGRIILNGS
jgi:hypothetical protein